MVASRMGFFFKPMFKVKGENLARTANLALQVGMNLTLVHLFANTAEAKPQLGPIPTKEKSPQFEPQSPIKVLR